MPQPHYDVLDHVESVMNYLADEETNPAYYLYEPKPNFTPPPPAAKKSTVKIYDIRSCEHHLTLDLNGFQASTARIDALIAGREIYGEGSVPTDHSLVANVLGFETKLFVKMFPKYPIIYFTRWGNMRKPFDLQMLRDNPVDKVSSAPKAFKATF